ncbi:TolC family protein [Portibacter lacus]|uniref:Transporter n=1 Tax=Portibacter lacus TaxID=1099794 RepID=A0AA37STS6_9BACT|nr:TolC family protein [Portibacter lacus]GLR19474.1 transporter [Portibacter lacus]
MKNILTITFSLLFLGSVFAQYSAEEFEKYDGQEITLEECIQFALDHNPQLKSIRMGEEANAYKIKEVKSAALPQINGTGQYLYNYALAEQLLPGEVFGMPGTTIPVKFGVANTVNANIELQQVIFNKAIGTGLKAAQASQEIYELNTFKSTEDLVYNIVQLYFQLQISEKQKVILQSNIDRIENLVRIARIQFQEGIIKKVDLDQLIINKANLLSERMNLEIGIGQQLNLLKFYMGMSTNLDISISEEAMEGDRYTTIANEVDINNNTNYRLLTKQEELSDLELESIKAGYYPSLAGFVRYGYQGQTDRIFSSEDAYAIQGSPTGVIGLSLSVPIFDGFKKSHQAQQIRVKQSQYYLDKQYLSNSVEMEFANAKEKLRQNRVLLETQKENMEFAEELYEVTKLSYQEGVAPLTELLDAETSLKESQTQYLTSLLQVNLAELEHIKSSGQLSKILRSIN